MSIPAIKLTREIKARCVRFAGLVAKEEKRPELLPFLLEAGEPDGISAETAAEILLGSRQGRKSIATQVLDRLVKLSLLEKTDRNYWLTEEGQSVLDRKVMFIPERGNWSIWYADDPLIPDVMLKIEPYTSEPKAFDDVQKVSARKGYGRNSNEKRSFTSPDDVLKALVSLPVMPAEGGEKVRIDEFPEKVEDGGRATIRLTWNVTGKRLTLDGELEGKPLNVELSSPSMTSADVWQQILSNEGLLQDWDPKQGKLRRGFDETGTSERRSLRMEQSFGRSGTSLFAAFRPSGVRLDEFGTFDPLDIADIAIRARTSEDAQLWAEWRLKDLVGDYATQTRFEEWQREASMPFSEFGLLELSSRKALAEAELAKVDETGERNKDYWRIVAAEDWRL